MLFVLLLLSRENAETDSIVKRSPFRIYLYETRMHNAAAAKNGCSLLRNDPKRNIEPNEIELVENAQGISLVVLIS